MIQIAQTPHYQTCPAPVQFSATPLHSSHHSFQASAIKAAGVVGVDVDRAVISLVKQRARRVQAHAAVTVAPHERRVSLTRALTLRASVVESTAQMEAAKLLIRRRYSWRGYDMPEDEQSAVQEAFAPDSSQVVLVATLDTDTIGTITLGLDRPSGLLAERSYGEVIQQCRGAGKKVCEVTRLAVAEEAESKRVLAALFSLTWAAASVNGVTDMFVEVNPRHVVFYRRILGFAVAAGERFCERVRAPSTLLHVDMDDLEDRLTRMNQRVAAMEPQAEAA